MHSGKGQSWGGRGLDPFGIQNLRQDVVTFLAGQSVQTMQMLADWYTILTAKEVYHTHSDFSISAVHFQNLPSKSIQGYNATAGKLELIDESWLVDGETERLVDRRVDGEGTSRLRECIPTSHRKKDKHNHSHNHHEHKHRHHADDNPVP